MVSIRCSVCRKALAKSETKNCASCKAVIYCSKECQKAGWRKDHKDICARISNPQNDNDELRLWCTLWSTSFVFATVWALDVKNKPGYNTTHALMIFVKKTGKTDPAHRYRVYGECLVPISLPILKWHDVKSVPGQFYLSIQDPVADDGFRFVWDRPPCGILAPLMSEPDSAMLAKLAVPILRHVTETVSNVDAMAMWDPNVWLGRPHQVVKPENMLVMPEVLPEPLSHLFK